MQLDFLQENDEISLLKRELQEVRERSENTRKGLFARHNELIKLYMQLKEEVEHVKAIHAKKPVKAELLTFFNEVIEKY